MEYQFSSNYASPNGTSRVEPLSTKGILAAAEVRNSPPASGSERSPAKGSLHVAFEEKGEVKEKRERFLTAKYGSHQMNLIRKRLAVEMWMYEELQRLYGCTDDSQTHEVELDLDELLDLEDDTERRHFLRKLLADAKSEQAAVNKFIDELMQRTKVL